MKKSDLQNLLHWFRKNARDLPWRKESRSPYLVWVSEIMLQQTRVDTVVPYFREFISRFPDVDALAEADEEEVLQVWEGLGFYARARNLHEAAVLVQNEYGGSLPADFDELQNLPGIGPATAAAIMCFAFQGSVPYLDGNVFRVISRYHGYTENTESSTGKEFVRNAVRQCFHDEDAGRVNEALIELGALICTPTSPACDRCPISDSCTALMKNIQEQLPYRGETRNRPTRTRTAVAVYRDNELLLVRRPSEGLLGGMWELPALWVKEEEEHEETARRTLQWALINGGEIKKQLGMVHHGYSHFKLRMPVYLAETSDVETTHDLWNHRWLTASRHESVPIHNAARKGLELLYGEAENESS